MVRYCACRSRYVSARVPTIQLQQSKAALSICHFAFEYWTRFFHKLLTVWTGRQQNQLFCADATLDLNSWIKNEPFVIWERTTIIVLLFSFGREIRNDKTGLYFSLGPSFFFFFFGGGIRNVCRMMSSFPSVFGNDGITWSRQIIRTLTLTIQKKSVIVNCTWTFTISGVLVQFMFVSNYRWPIWPAHKRATCQSWVCAALLLQCFINMNNEASIHSGKMWEWWWKILFHSWKNEIEAWSCGDDGIFLQVRLYLKQSHPDSRTFHNWSLARKSGRISEISNEFLVSRFPRLQVVSCLHQTFFLTLRWYSDWLQ